MSEARGNTIGYNLSNDFPVISCFVSDTNAIPNNAIPLILAYDYDMVVLNESDGSELSDKQISKIIPKIEESMLRAATFDLFNCEVTSRVKRDESGLRALQELDYSANIHIVGLDYQPEDEKDEDYACKEESVEGFEAGSVKCVPIRGAMAVSLTEIGAENKDAIAADLLEFIQMGMDSNLFLDASNKLIKLEYVGDRSTLSASDPVTNSADLPDFVAALPGDGTTTENTNRSDGNNAWGIVEVGGIIIGFLVLLLLLVLLAYRKRQNNKGEKDNTGDKDELEVVELEEQDLESNDGTDVQSLHFLGIGPRPEYCDGANLGQVYRCHDVHQCRSQTCESCKSRVTFIAAKPN